MKPVSTLFYYFFFAIHFSSIKTVLNLIFMSSLLTVTVIFDYRDENPVPHIIIQSRKYFNCYLLLKLIKFKLDVIHSI